MSLSGLWTRLRARFYKSVSDKRKYPRVPISVKVTNLTSGSFTYYQASNISSGGIFLKSDEPLASGSRLSIKFSLPDSDEALNVEGVVVRIQHGLPNSVTSGMGIKFQNASPDFRKAVDSFIQKQL